MDLKKLIRTIPDYPKEGIQFRDITPLLEHPEGLGRTVEAIVAPMRDAGIDCVAGIEARGFIIGAPVAQQLGVGFVAIRKKGKLPYTTHSVKYDLEYGSDEMEMHIDSVGAGDRVLLVDDLIATGGSACAAIDLIQQSGGKLMGASFVIDLPDLGGSRRLEAQGVPVHRLMDFEGG
ncbi:MAG: adenine phosphoribosyltransferase [Myxococcota bacterium]|nr:adenine phosphoribosyltransferase [Myxococcota bacterium]